MPDTTPIAIENVLAAAKHFKLVRTWDEKESNQFLPFKNGVLELATGKLHKHNPDFFFTWRLERDYQPQITQHPVIDQFLWDLAEGSQETYNVLLAFAAAVVTGRADLHLYLELIGKTRAGKGTYVRLLELLIGSENVCTSDLKLWCEDKFATKQAEHKRLLVFSDVQESPHNPSRFLNVTGQDMIPAEEKGKQAYKYQYGGMVLMACNEQVYWGKSKDAIAQRRITVKLTKGVAPEKRRDLMPDFEQEIAAFTNTILAIPRDTVTKTLKAAQSSPARLHTNWLMRIEIDPLAAWVNDWVISDPSNAWSVNSAYYIEPGSTRPEFISDLAAYPHYREYCKVNGYQRPISIKKFSTDLIKLCNDVLDWNVSKEHSRKGAVLKGIAPKPLDKGVLTVEELLERHILDDRLQIPVTDTSHMMDCDGLSDGLHPIQGKLCDGLTDNSLNLSQINNINISHSVSSDTSANESTYTRVLDDTKSEILTKNGGCDRVQIGINPSQPYPVNTPSITHSSQKSACDGLETITQLKEGDLVKHSDPYQAYSVRLGRVVEVQVSDVKVDWHHTDHKPELHEMSELERLQLSGNKRINEKVYPKLQSATNYYWYDTDIRELKQL